MEFPWHKKEPEYPQFNKLIRLQRDLELTVMRDVTEKIEEVGVDTSFMVGATQNLGALPIHEERNLQFLVADLEDSAVKYGENDPELLKQFNLLRGIRAITDLKLSLMPPLPDEKRTLLKESAQIQIYDLPEEYLDSEIYDILLDYLDEMTPNIPGVDFTDEESIKIAEKLVKKQP